MDNHDQTYQAPSITVAKRKSSLLTGLLKVFLKLILVIATISVFVLLIVTPLTYAYFVRDISNKEIIMNKNNTGVILTDRNGEPYFSLFSATSKTTVPLSQISPYMQHAVIASEDKEFYQNPGFSIRGILRSVFVNLSRQQVVQGGSTITQQLVKNTLLSHNRNIIRKLQEIILAVELDRRYSKEDILEMYLNTVYFGEGAFSVEDAALIYFAKPASQLTLAESALLTGLLPAPSAYSPLSGDADKAFEQQQLVLEEMFQQGYITLGEKQQAELEAINFNTQGSDYNKTAPHFALMVKDELIKKYGEQRLAQSGFTVRTTIDLKSQQFAENTVRNQVARLNSSNVSNGAAVVINPKTGEILSLVGSYNWSDPINGKLNIANRPRSPGSSFKPFVYAAAFELRFLNPGSILDDKETAFPGGYKPKNFDNKHRGKVTVRRALANSLNIPAVLTIQQTGVPAALEMAERLGIDTLVDPSQYGLSLVLGAGEVPLVEMTNAYAVFANEGTYNKPVSILEIKDKNGAFIYAHNPQPVSVLAPGVAFLISSILSDNNTRKEVFGDILDLSRPAAVKTGTSESFRDSLTLGYTPGVAVGVWVGNNDNRPMNSIAGATGAAPIWKQLMEHFLAGTPEETFTPPADVIQATACRNDPDASESAERKQEYYREYFLIGTVPPDRCTMPLSPTGFPLEDLNITGIDLPTGTPFPSSTPRPTSTPRPLPTVWPTTTPAVTAPQIPFNSLP